MLGLVVYFLIGTFIIAQIFQWATIYDDEKSIAFSMTFEDPTKTLEAQEVDKVIQQVLNRLEREIGAKLR